MINSFEAIIIKDFIDTNFSFFLTFCKEKGVSRDDAESMVDRIQGED